MQLLQPKPSPGLTGAGSMGKGGFEKGSGGLERRCLGEKGALSA